jgi:hypothetical protein
MSLEPIRTTSLNYLTTGPTMTNCYSLRMMRMTTKMRTVPNLNLKTTNSIPRSYLTNLTTNSGHCLKKSCLTMMVRNYCSTMNLKTGRMRTMSLTRRTLPTMSYC